MEKKIEMLYKIFCAKAELWAGRNEDCKWAYQNAAAIVLLVMEGDDEALREVFGANVMEEE